MTNSLSVTGVVKLRSSSLPEAVRAEVPPGEAEVLRLNPQRANKLCSITGWPRLESGTLNVVIGLQPFKELMRIAPIWSEDGASIVYPARFAHIPIQRGPYLYYKGTAIVGKSAMDVLARRPTNAISTTIELYAAVKLMDALGVHDGDRVTVEIGLR